MALPLPFNAALSLLLCAFAHLRKSKKMLGGYFFVLAMGVVRSFFSHHDAHVRRNPRKESQAKSCQNA